MTWFKEIPMPLDNHNQHCIPENYRFRIKLLEQTIPPINPDFINDIVLQWVILPFLVSENVVFRISVHDSELKEYTLANLTNLFHQVRGLFVNGELIEIRLMELKQHIKDSFTKTVLDANKLDPLVHDVYLRKSVKLDNQLDIKLYEIDMKKFVDLTHYHTETKTNHIKLWDFIMRLNPNHDEITLFPVNWVFNDLLLESPFLLFLSRYADEIVLTVNQNDLNVRAISFKGHPI